MPKCVSDRIQLTTQRAILALCYGKDTLERVHIYGRGKAQLIGSLVSWRGKLQSEFSAADVTKSHLRYYKDSSKGHYKQVEKAKTRRCCKQDIAYSMKTGAHWLPATLT